MVKSKEYEYEYEPNPKSSKEGSSPPYVLTLLKEIYEHPERFGADEIERWFRDIEPHMQTYKGIIPDKYSTPYKEKNGDLEYLYDIVFRTPFLFPEKVLEAWIYFRGFSTVAPITHLDQELISKACKKNKWKEIEVQVGKRQQLDIENRVFEEYVLKFHGEDYDPDALNIDMSYRGSKILWGSLRGEPHYSNPAVIFGMDKRRPPFELHVKEYGCHANYTCTIHMESDKTTFFNRGPEKMYVQFQSFEKADPKDTKPYY